MTETNAEGLTPEQADEQGLHWPSGMPATRRAPEPARLYTEDDLRHEAARQHVALTQDPDYVGVGEQMTGTPIHSRAQEPRGCWHDLDDLPGLAFGDAQGRIHDLITGATAPPPWLSLDGGDRLVHDPGHDLDPPVYVVHEPLDSPEAAEHFALMDPAVADGVYAWLEATAAYLDQLTPEHLEEDEAASHALTVAAALLREPAEVNTG